MCTHKQTLTYFISSVSAKIRNLADYQNKILYNIAPLPTGVDIANTLKYFIHTLRSILKGAPADLPGGKHPSRKRVNFRLQHFPSLDYLGLFETLVSLIDIVPNIQYGQFAFGHAILQLFGVIIWFLEPETVDTIPYTVASTLAVFPLALQPDTIELLAGTLLPLCLSDVQHWDGETFATMSMSSVIMLVLQHTKNIKKNKEMKARALNAQVLECIMTYKEGVFRDILSAIAFGPATARAAGAQLLFHYWPTLVPTSHDNRDFKYCSWKPFLCQRSNCLSPVNNAAVKMCLDPAIAATYSKEPPPFYLCSVCSDHIAREEEQFITYDVLNPLERETRTCENKNCASSDKKAHYTCFSSDCVRQNGNIPIAYCTGCHQSVHPREVRQEHVVQSFPSDPWACDKETQIYLVEAIISLLKEARVEEVDPLMAAMEVTEEPESTDEYSQLPMESDGTDDEDATDRDPRLLSRFGLWLLIEKCTPNKKTSDEVIGRLLSMLFQWFGFTATLTQDSIVLESLKKEYVTEWILKLLKTHFNVFANCLMPSPPEYGKVGGYWDTLCSRITELQEGLKKIFSMTPYNAITFEVWHEMMPTWMDAICTDIDEKDLPQLQEVLCKLFDIDISPLPFSTEKTFEFVACKFKETPAKTQEKALLWLQVRQIRFRLLCVQN
ncbi:Protein unc-79-like [Holothuria leucospilota]|uniref:Protein unc-79-like n=1 Tax=Holothuria leucospilota TaxID=206669 RepID=A0A9Q1C6R2_HOLLE|nr:Protein unc-79-like [Holothuria leucospilota]